MHAPLRSRPALACSRAAARRLARRGVATPAVRFVGDPVLSRPSPPVADLHDPRVVEGSAMLRAALERFRAEHGFGRAIAAPQIGLPMRMVAFNLGQGTHVMYNPEIYDRSEETFTLWDDCMSFPDMMVRVRRHSSVSVRFLDEGGEQRAWPLLDRATSELLQHEIDHLDGVTSFDRIDGARGAVVHRSAYEANKTAFDATVDYAIQPTL